MSESELLMWRCAKYFVISTCVWVPRDNDNRYAYMAHVCFYVRCSDWEYLLCSGRC